MVDGRVMSSAAAIFSDCTATWYTERVCGKRTAGYRSMMPRRNVAIEPLIEAMKVAAAALRDAEIKFALAGGLAIWARGGRSRTTTSTSS